MPFEIIRNDITKLKVDAIVNAANASLLGGGGVDGAIHRAAGPKLLEACRMLNGCKTGDVKLTEGFNLPSKYVIHTVGPVWHGGGHNEEYLLRSCYQKALTLAFEKGLASIAFPLISSGVYGYPKDQAIEVAISEINLFLKSNDMMVYLVIFDRTATYLSDNRYSEIKAYIDDAYEENEGYIKYAAEIYKHALNDSDMEVLLDQPRHNVTSASLKERNLEDVLSELQATFSEHLFRLIDHKGFDDVTVYKRANIDRKLFSKIRSDRAYKPSKATVMALAISLELSFDEACDLMQKAGYAFSNSSKQDLIIRYFIEKEQFDIYAINLALFEFNEPLL